MSEQALAEKEAVTVQEDPVAEREFKLYASGETKGALKTCDPPHEFETVKVPDEGGFVNTTLPVTL